MRALRWAALLVAGLAAAVALGVAVVVPRWLEGAGVRAQVIAAAEGALDRECDFEALEVDLFPPSLVIVAPAVAGEEPGAEPFAVAERVALHLSLRPLLAGLVWIDSLEVEAARVRLVRTPEGLLLPGETSATGPPPEDPAEPAGLAFSVRQVELRGAALVFEDRTRTPVQQWQLAPVEITARGGDAAAPFEVELSVAGPRDGRLESRGTATLDLEIDLEGRVDSFDLATLQPFLAREAELSGLVTGRIDARGPVDALERVCFDLEIREADWRLEELHAVGAVSVRGEVRELAAPSGRFEADATEAEVRYGEIFTKPPGTPAQLEGRIVTGADGLDFDDVRLRIRGLDDGGAPLGISGRLLGAGETLRSEERERALGDQRFPLALKASDLEGSGHTRTHLGASRSPGVGFAGSRCFEATLRRFDRMGPRPERRGGSGGP